MPTVVTVGTRRGRGCPGGQGESIGDRAGVDGLRLRVGTVGGKSGEGPGGVVHQRAPRSLPCPLSPLLSPPPCPHPRTPPSTLFPNPNPLASEALRSSLLWEQLTLGGEADSAQSLAHSSARQHSEEGRCGEMCGDAGRCGEMWGDVGRCGEVWGDVGRRWGFSQREHSRTG